MQDRLLDNDNYPAPEEGAEEVGESVTDRKEATPSRVVKRSTQGRRPKKSKATKRKIAKVTKPPVSKTVAIQSLHSGIVVATGPSGETYRWPAPGSIVQVAESDVDSVMKKNGSEARECCGSSGPPIYFLLVD